MKSFETSIQIKATPEKIWKILTDGPNYASWNTTFKKLDGTIALGQRIALDVKISPRIIKVTVSEFVPNERMVWSDGMPFGLFKAARTYTLTPKGEGIVEFHMKEIFSGLLSPLIEKTIPDLNPAFKEFAECLKRTAE
jgi:hypothetical protein